MSNEPTRWTEVDFDEMNWHDVHVHAMRITEGEYGAGEVRFDLDYILQWVCGDDGSCKFRVAPAQLVFREATDLRINLDYAAESAALGPFSIDGIRREQVDIGGSVANYRWTVPVNWPRGEIAVESPGFVQTLTGPIVETDKQYLDPIQR